MNRRGRGEPKEDGATVTSGRTGQGENRARDGDGDGGDGDGGDGDDDDNDDNDGITTNAHLAGDLAREVAWRGMAKHFSPAAHL